ncbi:hypothetical protein [Erythrobacter sp. Dej080120_24]|uniref:hypothetical protein n=1 Tax=Erythrobacter sp. Dej080120_24 TaxID=3024837 RepID=UPI0030C751B6
MTSRADRMLSVASTNPAQGRSAQFVETKPEAPAFLAEFIRIAALTAIGASIIFSNPAGAQTTTDDTIDTAKPADTVSPYGVSYHTGSFTYSVPLFTIGHGEWPNQITVSLNYDSSGARYPNNPWTLNIQRRMSGSYESYPTGFEGDVLSEQVRHGLNIVTGNGSTTFYLGGRALNTNNFQPASLDGSKIEFTEGPSGAFGGINFDQHGEFKATLRDGTTIEFPGGLVGYEGPVQASGPPHVTLPSGHVIDYSQPLFWSGSTSYSGGSTGLLIRMFGNQVCAFNAAVIDPSTVTSCSQSNLVATIVTQPFGSFGTQNLVTSVTRPDGGTYTFEYQAYYSSSVSPDGQSSSARTRYHLSCVREPGQAGCAVQNSYDACDGSGWAYFSPNYFGTGSWGEFDSEWSGSRDRVSSQMLADGRTVSYTYTGGSVGPLANGPCDDVHSVTMNEGGAITQIELAQKSGSKSSSPGLSSITDPLGRETNFAWTGANVAAASLKQDDKLASVEYPDGRRVEFLYDARGNRTQTRIIGRPGSGDADIITSAAYPSTCSNPKVCNQPSSVTDARGNTTTYTYSTTHGGVLTSVGPMVGGIAPATKYYYVQREAWLRSGSGFAKTGSPIWLLSEERSCRTSALNLSNGTCSAGANDLVRTVYDYGPDSGPNNLWLRGVAVTSEGQTLRTCYSYDAFGRRISETQPKANLTSCP